MNIQFQGDEAVATVDGGQSPGTRQTFCNVGEFEAVFVVPCRGTNGIVKQGVIYRVDGQLQSHDRVTPPAGKQG